MANLNNRLLNKKNSSISILVPRKKKKAFDPLKVMSLKYLVQNKHFKEPKWFVKPFITEGLTILAGKPKIGKSLFALYMGITIAQGFRFMKKFNCTQSAVYYLSYEDPARRIQNRTIKMIGKNFVPKNFLLPIYAEGFPKMNNGGFNCIKKIIEEKENVGVIIIDTLGRFVDKRFSGNLNFQEDYDLLSKLQVFANKKHIAIILLHHTTKKTSEDPFDEIQGTIGYTASCDNLIVMRRNNGMIDVHTRGRDFEDQIISVEMDKSTLKWGLKGNARESGLSIEAKQILSLLKKDPHKFFGVKEIRKFTEDSSQNTENKIKRLMVKDLIIKNSRNMYQLNLDMYEKLK